MIGGCEDDALSELTLRELETAPSAVREVLRVVPADHIEFLRLTQPAAELAQRYLAEGVPGPGMLADAEHIAMASVACVDVLASWNFRHIVNLPRIQRAAVDGAKKPARRG